MDRRLPFLLLLVLGSALPAAAQQLGGSGLRGSAAPEDSLSGPANPPLFPAASEEAGTDPVTTGSVGTTPAGRLGVTAERGSSGLVAGGRQDRVRPFADRLSAVRRAPALGGTGGTLADDVFDGDTSYDAPTGLRVGTFTIIPQVTVTGGWSTNAAGSSSGRGNALYAISPDIAATSNWSRHELSLSLRGSYSGFPGSRIESEPSITGTTALRLDLTDTTEINTSAGLTYARETQSTAENPSGQGDVYTMTGSAGVTHAAGLIGLTLRGDVERTAYTREPVGGSNNRDNTVLSATVRADALTGATLQPFVEVTALRRAFDYTCDAACVKRDATGYELKAGTTVAAGPKLAGEIGAGWRVERMDAKALGDLSGLVVDASLVWSPSRLTTVTAGVGTTFAPSFLPTASGSILYSGDLRLAHSFSDRFVAETGVGYQIRKYEGTSIEERTASALAGVTYAVTRNVALTGNYTFRAFDSSQAGADYNESRLQAGVRIRR
ncbi:outer membrane beta-barrel protein [Pannonibacter tanglangensis]|uniref:Outer membrane beta-barrel protein n=1 Tax=Pannonibacter tanglangensis TaxID=2750084 RepID=A0ABW9ZKB1_9HYPH|nr:outer membrane beta-barrel protein [Pannonibacter sp. XCT-34]NBN65315.1 outer membrane beta-barrel protein [Pannonibacter sp. XCT-34]